MLYHKELGFPKTLKLKDFYVLKLIYSEHAINSSKSDRYGKIDLPKEVDVDLSEIIEVETFDNITPSKIVARIHYSSMYDLCIVILLDRSFVKTVWLNSRYDCHKTLDATKYSKL